MQTTMNLNSLLETVAALQPSYEEFLAKLVTLPSTRGHEREAQEMVEAKMIDIGLDVSRVYSRDDDQALNLCGVLPGVQRDTHRSIILNAHCDVTPVDKEEAWTAPPFAGVVKDRLLYGRGSVDDKAGVAIIVLVADALRKSGTVLGGDLLVQSVIDDETSGSGTKALVSKGFTADGVVICDGTWPWRIIDSHLGQLFLDVKIQGEPAAACVESRGVNPIYIAMDFISTLRQFVADKKKQNPLFERIDDPYFCNVGSIRSGTWHGSVPVDAELKIQLGFADTSPEEMLSQTQTIAERVSDRIDVQAGTLLVPPYPASTDNELIPALRDIVNSYGEQVVKTTSVTGHCDLQYFPTSHKCLYGPGGGKNPHAIDEHYMLDHMPIVARNIAQMVYTWCSKLR